MLRIFLALWLAFTPTFVWAGNMMLLGAGKAQAGGGNDPATTAWVAAVVAAGGTVGGTQTTRVNTLIVALKGHGLFSKLDRLWLWAGENDHHQATIDIINLGVGTEHGNLTSTGFNASGYTGDGATGYFDSQFNPGTAGGNYTSAAASAGAYTLNNRTSGGNQDQLGCKDGPGNITEINPKQFGSFSFNINNGTPGTGGIGTNGFWAVTQLSGTASTYNWSTTLGNSGSQGTAANGSPVAPSANVTFVAFNFNGSVGNFETSVFAAGFLGGGLSAPDMANLAADLNAYMTAWGVNQF